MYYDWDAVNKIMEESKDFFDAAVRAGKSRELTYPSRFTKKGKL
jgi:hypothetical protein